MYDWFEQIFLLIVKFWWIIRPIHWYKILPISIIVFENNFKNKEKISKLQKKNCSIDEIKKKFKRVKRGGCGIKWLCLWPGKNKSVIIDWWLSFGRTIIWKMTIFFKLSIILMFKWYQSKWFILKVCVI